LIYIADYVFGTFEKMKIKQLPFLIVKNTDIQESRFSGQMDQMNWRVYFLTR